MFSIDCVALVKVMTCVYSCSRIYTSIGSFFSSPSKERRASSPARCPRYSLLIATVITGECLPLYNYLSRLGVDALNVYPSSLLNSFGLPGLLCLMGTDRDRDAPPIDIYGPEGLRMWLRVAIRYSVSRVVPPYRVHELMDVPMAPEWEQGHRRNGRFYYQLKNEGGGRRWGNKGLAGEDAVSWISRAPMMNLEPSRDFGEIEGGRDIYPRYDHPQCHDGAPVWEVEKDSDVSVHAAPMSHGVPCVGYVIEEHDRPGRLQPENVLPVIERNHAGLIEAGVRHPMKVMAMVKNLPVGGSYTFPDGTVVKQEDVVEPPRKGRKVVICGDTADCRGLEGLAQGADVLVHEATNTFLPGVDKDGDLRGVTRDAKIHGHSTPFMVSDLFSCALY